MEAIREETMREGATASAQGTLLGTQESRRFQLRLNTLFQVTGACACLFALIRVCGEILLYVVYALIVLGVVSLVAWGIVLLLAWMFDRILLLGVVTSRLFLRKFWALARVVDQNRSSLANRAAVLIVVFGVPGLLLMPSLFVCRCGGHARVQMRMRSVSIALQMYQAEHGEYPPAFIADEQGRPMHSWRVLLLPYLDEPDLYARYDFSEPWDGPNNKKLHDEVVDIYGGRYGSGPEATATEIVAVVGEGMLWPGDRGWMPSEPLDTVKSTIQLVELPESGIHWMEPRDLDMATLQELVDRSLDIRWKKDREGDAVPIAVAYFDGHVKDMPIDDLATFVRSCRAPVAKSDRATIVTSAESQSTPSGRQENG